MSLIPGDYPEKLVLRVNELYHDLYFQCYKTKHLDKMDPEKPRWKKAGEKFFSSEKPLTVLDLGSGTGFVALTTAAFLKAGDIFICSDVSSRSLKEAKKNIEACDFSCRFKYVKLEPEVSSQMPFESMSLDIITMNSVLHHIKNTDAFLGEIDRILRPGGLLLIGHEPNSYHLESRLLGIIDKLAHPRAAIDEYVLKYSAVKTLKQRARSLFAKKRQLAAEHERLTIILNKKLLEEGIIEKGLLPEEIKRITDIRAMEGFKPDRLLEGYNTLYLETYNYLGPVGGKHGFAARSYENLMKKIMPRSGAIFFVALRKNSYSGCQNNFPI